MDTETRGLIEDVMTALRQALDGKPIEEVETDWDAGKLLIRLGERLDPPKVDHDAIVNAWIERPIESAECRKCGEPVGAGGEVGLCESCVQNQEQPTGAQ